MTKKEAPSNITRFIIYPIIGLVFLSALSILITLASGYNFNFKDGRIELKKTGMIILSSRPADARIYLDGKDTKKKTFLYFINVEFRNLFPKDYLLEVKKDGHRTWSKNVTIKPSLVTWANYILLFPLKFEAEVIPELAGLSPIGYDRQKDKTLMVKTNIETGINEYYIHRPKDDRLDKLNLFPSTSPVALNISDNDFSPDGKKLIFKNVDKWYLFELDSEGTIAREVTPLNLLLPNRFDFAKDNNLYGLIADDLYRITFSADGVINYQLVLTEVVDYSLDKTNAIIAVRKNQTDNFLARYNFDGNSEKIIYQKLEVANRYHLDYSTKKDTYTVLLPETGSLNLIYQREGNFIQEKVAEGITDVTFHTQEKRLVFYDFSNIYCLDLEKDEEFHFDLGQEILSVDWYFDDSHLVVNSQNGLSVIEYDGANQVVITKEAGNYLLYGRDDFFLDFPDGKQKKIEFNF